MNYLKVDVAKDECGAVAPPRRRPSLLYLPTISCLFCKLMKTKSKRLRELCYLCKSQKLELLCCVMKFINHKVSTYKSANIFPSHRLVITYGHMLELQAKLIDPSTGIPAFLYSNSFLPQTPNGKPSTLHFSVIILVFEMTLGTPFPSQLKFV